MLFVSVTTISLVGNSLILWVLWILPDARSSTNLLIGNMALANLPTAVIFCSAGIYKFISAHCFLAGPFMCQYELSLKFCCLTATNLSLVTMAADRLKNFYWPNSCKKITIKQTLLICIVIWLFSVGFGFLFASVRRLKHVNWQDFDEYQCVDASKHHYDFWLLCLAFLVYIPITTMVIIYSLIVKKLWQFEERMVENERPSFSKPVIQMIWLYLIVTIICYVPFQFLLIRREIFVPTKNEHVSHQMTDYSSTMKNFFIVFSHSLKIGK